MALPLVTLSTLFLALTGVSAEDPLEGTKRLDAEVVTLYREGRYAEAIAPAREALRIREQALGPAHPDVAQSLNNLASLLRVTGDYAGARPLSERALRIREQALGPAHPDVAQSLNNLALLLDTTGDYAGARPLYERALQIREQALGPAHPDVAQSLNNLAALLQATGDYSGAQPMYERALRIFEQALGPGHPDVAHGLNNLAFLRQTTGDYVGARPLYERALRVREQALGPGHPDVALSLNNLAELLRLAGDYTGARPLYEQALRIFEQVLGPGHPTVAASLNNLAGLLQATGDFGGARPLYERALRIREQALGPGHPDVALSLNNLADLLRVTGDSRGARPLYERALSIREQVLGPGHPDVALSLNNLAFVLRRSGDDAGARSLYERALRIREQALGPGHPDVASSLNNLAFLLKEMGDHTSARLLYERALRIFEQVLGPGHPNVASSLTNLAGLLQATGDYTQARPLYERALLIFQQGLGAGHPSAVHALNNLAELLRVTGDYVGARPLFERGRMSALAQAHARSDLDDDAQRALHREAGGGLWSYVGLLAAIAREPAKYPGADSATADAFMAVEQARGGAAQVALARAAARVAAGDTATATLARQVEDLRDRLGTTRKQVVAEHGRPPGQRDPAQLPALQTAAEVLERDLRTALARLRAAFPRYGELAAPDPVDVATMQQLLQSDEALLSVFTLDDRVLLWLLRPGRPPVYHDREVKRGELARLVRRVRASLDQSVGADLAAGQFAPFDVAGANELYRLLVEPVVGTLTDVRHLIVVPDDVLLPLPFAALVASAEGEAYRGLAELYARGLAPAPADLAQYAKLSWLTQRYAVTVLPAATALRALRQVPRTRVAAAEPLIGFGDPVLDGTGRQRGGTMLAARGAAVSLNDVRRLDRLPGTRDELLALATAFGVDPQAAVYLDARATKSEVLRLNAGGRLGKARVLAFATHGLVGGEVKGLRQPALVLTPPATPSEQDDGLLSLDDIVGLSLGAEWVVLSACNTAAADRSGEGLSGLVRAFFFAGAPSLLVSHWSVDDRATQALMSRVFERYAREPRVRKTETLRQAMLELMASARGPTAYFAHPFAWAPFFLVGEGN